MAAWPPNLEEAGWEPTHWAYLAEGGANIIYRYTGPPEWPFVNTLGNGQSIVLRVKKEVPEPDAHVVPYPDEYLENVIAHLLPTSSLPVLRKIPVDDQLRTFLQTLVHQSEQVRPSSRRTKSNIDLSAPFIWAMPDLSRSSVPGSFVVEIKPKCGFLPTMQTKYPCKRAVSRYRMHRVLKTLQSSPSSPDLAARFLAWYDPLDLFSGDEQRVQRAVYALCSDWVHGEGNMKILFGGKVQKPSQLVKLLTWLGEEPVLTLTRRISSIFMQPANQALLTSIVQAQQILDPMDIEGIAKAWAQVMQCNLCDANDDMIQPITLQEYKEAVLEPPAALNEPNVQALRKLIVAHMLSATIKDLSLLFTVTPDLHPPCTTIFVVDLDAKRVSKLKRYAALDIEVARTFTCWSQSNLK